MTDYRARSLWLDGVPGELTPRPSLPGPIDVDVAIVGAGFTGLWTAYYLKRPTRTCASPFSSARSPASAPRDATAAGATPRSRARASRRRETHGRRR